MDTTIIIPTRHRPEALRSTLTDILQQSPANSMRILVLHDSPNDTEQLKVVEELRPSFGQSLTELYFNRKMSLTRMWNIAVMSTTSDWLLFLNDDIRMEPGWFEHLERMTKEPVEQIHLYAWYGVAISRKLFGRIGWFDERFVSGGFEDIDWDVRLNEANLLDLKDATANSKFVFQSPNRANIIRKETWDMVPNQKIFNSKWKHQFEGTASGKWNRQVGEIDWHPFYREEICSKYGIASQPLPSNGSFDTHPSFEWFLKIHVYGVWPPK